MEFIAQNTTIRVPRVLDVFSIRGTVHIVQERIHGPVLEDVWHRLSAEEQRSAMLQVKDCFDQLRALQPPHPERVQAVDGSGLIDSRVEKGEWGPFENHAAFHRFLNHDIYRAQPEKYSRMQDALTKIKDKQYKSVFSHGDFGPHNLIWRDGTIFVIDWERSGWFPEYYDFTRAHTARGDMKDWWTKFEEVVDRYGDELELEIRFCEYFESWIL
ncbi:protein kinase subdomain-containing protein PKL/CAK/CAK-fungal1, variant 2 [Coprinopsis cinerea AmutBmut pab1-1]|nr:protein kinase subdomain-containing protein PKL/CAK/CAK-fungal1, variant 2 [Coprinopsis cinerea AmutBmut pab1-1]